MTRPRGSPTNTQSSLLIEIMESVRYAQLSGYIITPRMVHGGAGRRCPVTPDRYKYCIDSIIDTPEPSIIWRTPTAHRMPATELLGNGAQHHDTLNLDSTPLCPRYRYENIIIPFLRGISILFIPLSLL